MGSLHIPLVLFLNCANSDLTFICEWIWVSKLYRLHLFGSMIDSKDNIFLNKMNETNGGPRSWLYAR